MLKAPVIVLREGTDTSQGAGQLISNINACQVLVDTVRTTLGPRGMDKLIVKPGGREKAVITNDGATIMKQLDVVHPAAKLLVDIARAQDAEVGDGTTSVVVLAGEILRLMKPFIEDGLAPQVLIRAVRKAQDVALARVKEIAIHSESVMLSREQLVKCAGTAMNSKLIHHQRSFFSEMVVDAVQCLDLTDGDPVRLLGMKRVTGGGLQDSRLVSGVAFERTFSYAGFEQQPKAFEKPLIICLNIELELRAERDNAEVRIDRVSEYQAIVDAEWSILYSKLDAIAATGAKIVLSRLAIGDVATQYFADRDIFCAGRVAAEDLDRVVAAVGGSILTALDNKTQESSGTCEKFEEIQIGGKRFNLFTGCPKAKTCTIILRGGSEQFLAEVERSLHDAIMVVRRAARPRQSLVAGGGAVEMEVSRAVREAALSTPGTAQSIMAAYAQAFEVIPRQLCDNAGLDSTDMLAKLRRAHSTSIWAGVDLVKEQIGDMWAAGVWEPSLVKQNMIAAAGEAVCAVLSVDLTIRNVPASSEDSLAKMANRAGVH